MESLHSIFTLLQKGSWTGVLFYQMEKIVFRKRNGVLSYVCLMGENRHATWKQNCGIAVAIDHWGRVLLGGDAFMNPKKEQERREKALPFTLMSI